MREQYIFEVQLSHALTPSIYIYIGGDFIKSISMGTLGNDKLSEGKDLSSRTTPETNPGTEPI